MFVVLVIIIAIFVYSPTATHAVTPTTTPVEASPSAELDRIQKIKELVASRVAELKLVEKRGILGTVTEATTTQIAIRDMRGTRRIIDIDDITKFDDSENKSFGISDVKKGIKLSIIGLYNKDTKRLLGRFVYTVTPSPTYFEGVIIDKDTKNFQLTAVDDSNNKRIIDIVASTKMYSFDNINGQVKSGFSKIEVGKRIFASGFMDKKVENQLDATRVIMFTSLALSNGMKKYQASIPTSEITPTKSVKITSAPITKQN